MAKELLLERHWCSEMVSIAHRGRRGRLKSIMGNLEEIGERTLVVLTEGLVPLGTWVRIRYRNQELSGVAEAREFDRQLGFFLKVRLAPGSRWTLRKIWPEHLFTVKDVLFYGRQFRHSA
jgi:hypothetical protein